jgi:acetoacetyl-CoA reductase
MAATRTQPDVHRPLTGQVALVTGASRGIGAAIARDLARAGAAVAINYLSHRDDARAIQDELIEAGERASVVQADVANADEIHAAIDQIIGEYGRLDILVNNAGILRDRSFKNMTADEWDSVIKTNLSGVFNTTHAAVPHMIAAGSGCIVNISSVIGQTGSFGQANYSAAKAGIVGLTKTLAIELARHGIRVNAICPGFVHTDMWSKIPEDVQASILKRIPLGRVAEPSEIADGVRYLIGATYVTGETLNLNGGLAMR